MPRSDALGDGQPQAIAAGVAVAAGVQARERLEDTRAIHDGDAGTIVVDDDAAGIDIYASAHFDALRGVALGILQHVAERARHQLGFEIGARGAGEGRRVNAQGDVLTCESDPRQSRLKG